jgi:hypothetical protein
MALSIQIVSVLGIMLMILSRNVILNSSISPIIVVMISTRIIIIGIIVSIVLIRHIIVSCCVTQWSGSSIRNHIDIIRLMYILYGFPSASLSSCVVDS